MFSGLHSVARYPEFKDKVKALVLMHKVFMYLCSTISSGIICMLESQPILGILKNRFYFRPILSTWGGIIEVFFEYSWFAATQAGNPVVDCIKYPGKGAPLFSG
jgi:hypothetical protein